MTRQTIPGLQGAREAASFWQAKYHEEQQRRKEMQVQSDAVFAQAIKNAEAEGIATGREVATAELEIWKEAFIEGRGSMAEHGPEIQAIDEYGQSDSKTEASDQRYGPAIHNSSRRRRRNGHRSRSTHEAQHDLNENLSRPSSNQRISNRSTGDTRGRAFSHPPFRDRSTQNSNDQHSSSPLFNRRTLRETTIRDYCPSGDAYGPSDFLSYGRFEITNFGDGVYCLPQQPASKKLKSNLHNVEIDIPILQRDSRTGSTLPHIRMIPKTPRQLEDHGYPKSVRSAENRILPYTSVQAVTQTPRLSRQQHRRGYLFRPRRANLRPNGQSLQLANGASSTLGMPQRPLDNRPGQQSEIAHAIETPTNVVKDQEANKSTPAKARVVDEQGVSYDIPAVTLYESAPTPEDKLAVLFRYGDPYDGSYDGFGGGEWPEKS